MRDSYARRSVRIESIYRQGLSSVSPGSTSMDPHSFKKRLIVLTRCAHRPTEVCPVQPGRIFIL